jgi:hypothetical protein
METPGAIAPGTAQRAPPPRVTTASSFSILGGSIPMLHITIHGTLLDVSLEEGTTEVIDLERTITELQRAGKLTRDISIVDGALLATSTYGDQAMQLHKPRSARRLNRPYRSRAERIAHMVADGQLRCTGIDALGRPIVEIAK